MADELPPYSRHVTTTKPSLLDPAPNYLTPILSAPVPLQSHLIIDETPIVNGTPTGIPDSPPAYSRLDETIQTLNLYFPFIYGTSIQGTCLPRYQIAVEYTRKGAKPYRLRIRRLLASETRRLSTSDSSIGRIRNLDFDNDLAMYLVENTAAMGFFNGLMLEIRGRQRHTLPGFVSLQTGSTGSSAKFWHVTRNAAGDALREANSKKIQKWGYKPEDEINKDLLFSVQKASKGEGSAWKDSVGAIVGTESTEGQLELVNVSDSRQRDLLATCWLARKFEKGQLMDTRGGDLKLPLRQVMTAGT